MLDMPLPVFDIAERAKDKPDVIHSASTQVSSFYVVIDVFWITYAWNQSDGLFGFVLPLMFWSKSG